MSFLERAEKGLSDLIANAPDVAEFMKGSTVSLAVTGLSRAGKTVFITSLVHNLLSVLHQPYRMPLLKAAGEGRLLGAKVAAGGSRDIPRFPYERNLQRMAADPADWPPPTTAISEIDIDLRFIPTGTVGFLLGAIGNRAATLRLKIVDYPGEWLLDLPLLTQTYAQWSRATLERCRRGIRAETAQEFIALISDLHYGAVASEDDAKRAHDSYRRHLLAARENHGLNFLQPGRFLNPDGPSDNSALWFAPLAVPGTVDTFMPNTLGALMDTRFERYKTELVMPFYRQHFRNFSRQVVLVDVLGALLAGQEVFEDTQRALDAILESFRYGQSGIISRLLGQSRIEKVLFAATKADHVPDVQRDHLGSLLRSMVALPAIEVRSSNAGLDVSALASAISTEEDTQEIDGHRVQVVVGKPVGSTTRAKFFVGNVPAKPPRPDAWGRPFLNIPVFEPPAIDASPIDGIPHINLDLALEYLIGDRLR